MLLSELEERERHFKLALRAGIPVVLLISLVFYSTFFREESFSFDMEYRKQPGKKKQSLS